MYKSIKLAFQDKVFFYTFLFCFILATPIFIKTVIENYEANTLTIVKCISFSFQYLFCVLSLPKFVADS